MNPELETFLKAAIAVGFLTLLIVGITTIAGCGSSIPIDPDCARLIEVQDEELASYECARPVDDCTDDYNEGYGDGFSAAADLCDLDGAFNEGYEAGVDTCEVCEEPEECEEPTSFEAICKRLPYGIRKKQPECYEYCHGKQHSAAPKCDRSCAPDDPICIPCDLELAVTCRTQCFETMYGRECVTVCEEDVA